MQFPKTKECVKCGHTLAHASYFSVRFRPKVETKPHGCAEALIYECKACGYSWEEECADSRKRENVANAPSAGKSIMNQTSSPRYNVFVGAQPTMAIGSSALTDKAATHFAYSIGAEGALLRFTLDRVPANSLLLWELDAVLDILHNLDMYLNCPGALMGTGTQYFWNVRTACLIKRLIERDDPVTIPGLRTNAFNTPIEGLEKLHQKLENWLKEYRKRADAKKKAEASIRERNPIDRADS